MEQIMLYYVSIKLTGGRIMAAYNIKITETMEREICIDASNELEAISEAMKKYQDRKYVLFPGVHVSTDFDIVDESFSERFKAAI